MIQEPEALAEEARYFHETIFRRRPPEQVEARYVAANRHCFADLPGKSERIVRSVVQKRLDPEAVEYVLRLRRGDEALTRKLQILFYLVEVRSPYYPYFVSRTPGLGRAVGQLLASLVRAGYQYIKGAYLIWRHRLV